MKEGKLTGWALVRAIIGTWVFGAGMYIMGFITGHIVGETNIYEKIKTPYKVQLNNKVEAQYFYKLVKALFILQTEVPNFFNFTTNINGIIVSVHGCIIFC